MNGLFTYFNDIEVDFCLRLNRLCGRQGIRRFFAAVSKLGDGGVWALMVLIMVSIQGPSALPSVLHLGSVTAVGILLYKWLKSRLLRERPYINHRGIRCGTAPLDRYSFPSGHTLHAASFATLLTAFEPALSIIVIPFAALVAVSRVILGLHYPSDVVAGAAIGMLLAFASLVV